MKRILFISIIISLSLNELMTQEEEDADALVTIPGVLVDDTTYWQSDLSMMFANY